MPNNTARVKKPVFLAAYAETGTITAAAKLANISRHTHYDWMKADEEYRVAFADAEEKAIDALEQEARRRAIVGTEEPVYHQGKVVGMIRKYSDTLLIFLLKGNRPGKYRERYEISGSEDAPLRVISGSNGHQPG
jgi:hypothetical protein